MFRAIVGAILFVAYGLPLLLGLIALLIELITEYWYVVLGFIVIIGIVIALALA